MSAFNVLVTVGPTILTQTAIERIAHLGNCIFRINGAHADHVAAKKIIGLLRSYKKDIKIVIDLPGNKIRTANLTDAIRLKKGESFELANYNVNYQDFYNLLKAGDIIYANDSTYKFEVISLKNTTIQLVSLSDGLLLNNKGLHLSGITENLPFIFERDLALIKLAEEEDVDHLSLSYVRSAEDIRSVKDKLSKNFNNRLIVKIETKQAINNLESILEESSIFNIDRGDLASEIGLFNLEKTVERVIQRCFESKKKIMLATQLLKTMENDPIPSLSEISYLSYILKKGINGVQLSEETAVGNYPYDAVKLVFALHKYVCQNEDA